MSNAEDHPRIHPRQGKGGRLVDLDLDRLARTAARLFGVQRAVITVSQPGTSGPGLDAAHATVGRLEFVEVPDLHAHVDVPVSAPGAPLHGLRYRLEVPLATDAGTVLGTLTLLDGAPRAALTGDDVTALQDVAGLAVDLLLGTRALDADAAEAQQLAYEDVLTRLPNRRAFEGALERAVTRGTPFGLVLLDLDELKRVNDEHGHAQGDHLLCSFAQELQGAFHTDGRAYRLGGDEFVVLLDGTSLSLQDVRARVNAVERQLTHAGLNGVLASLGMAQCPLDALAPNDLLRLADQRMIREKTARRATRGLGGVTLSHQPSPWSGEMLWQALRATAALISAEHDMGQAGWQAFLEAAVAALPGAEAGTLYVLEDGMFVLHAQVGYAAALLGVGRAAEHMRRWHGADWQGGEARVLRGPAVIQGRASPYDRLPTSAALQPEDLCATEQLQANLLVPVVVRGRVVAALNLDNLRSTQAFEPHEVSLAEEFGRQASSILAAREQRAREAARTRELEVLAHATAALAGVDSAEHVERILVAETRALLRTEHVVYTRHEPGVLRLVAQSGMYVTFGSDLVPHGLGVAWQALQTREVVHVPSILHDDRVYPRSAAVDGSLVVAPLILSAGTPMGALAAVRGAPGTFSDLDLQLLGALTSAGVTALERLQATAQERERAQESRILARLSDQLSLGDDARTVARACLETCQAFLNADVVAYVRPDRNVTVTLGPATEAFSALPDGWLEARVHDLRAGARAATFCADGPALRAAGDGADVHALVGVPVLERGQPAGVVALLWFRPLRALPPSAATLLTRTAELIGQVTDREAHIADLKDTREGALLALGLSLELRDFETAGHTERVVALAMDIARCLGVDGAALADLRVGAYLHDIGKLAVADAILLKPGKLDAAEWAMMQRHTTIGDELVSRIPTVTAPARSVVRSHHERWDGTGYPDGLAGYAIPEGARIFSVADVYDALTSVRPYKAAWTPEQAIAELLAQSGRQFDPDIVRAAVEILAPSPP